MVVDTAVTTEPESMPEPVTVEPTVTLEAVPTVKEVEPEVEDADKEVTTPLTVENVTVSETMFSVAAMLMVTVLAAELIAVTTEPETMPEPVTVEPTEMPAVEETDVSVVLEAVTVAVVLVPLLELTKVTDWEVPLAVVPVLSVTVLVAVLIDVTVVPEAMPVPDTLAPTAMPVVVATVRLVEPNANVAEVVVMTPDVVEKVM